MMTDHNDYELSPDDVMNRAREVKRRHETELMSIPGVLSVGVGHRKKEPRNGDEPCILLSVLDLVRFRQQTREDELPGEIEGVPVDVIEVGDISAH